MYKPENKYCVYKHTSPSGKVYIGITGQQPRVRWKYGDGYRNNPHFANAIKKYGWKNFRHEILLSNLPVDEAKEKEVELIALYNSTNPRNGYNRSPGGDMQSPDIRAKIKETRQKTGADRRVSEWLRMRWADPETRAEMLEKMRNVPPRSEEARRRYSEVAKRRQYSEATRAKLRRAMQARTGEKSSRGKRVCQVDIHDGHIINTFVTARAAAIEIGAGLNVIASTCRRPIWGYHISHGYYWCWEDDYDELIRSVELNPEIKPSGLRKRKPEESHNFGKPMPEKNKEAISASHRKAVMCVETGAIYKSLKEAAGHYGSEGSGAAISRQICGKLKKAFGHTWKYVDEEQAP